MELAEHQQLYHAADGDVRGKFSANASEAASYYRRYAELVAGQAPSPSGAILDIGCGTGWSTWLLKNMGFKVIGSDLHQGPLEAHAVDPDIEYISADAQALPFPESSFDAVGMHAVLEHVPSPQTALAEAVRVVRPGGRVIIVGPHMLSVGVALRGVGLQMVAAMRGRAHWRRHPGMPRHPFGNTLPEAVHALLHNAGATASRLFTKRQPSFLMREPDPNPPFHADNDACYYCNPMDLLAWSYANKHVRPIRWWRAEGPLARFLWPFGGGTWFVMEKVADR